MAGPRTWPCGLFTQLGIQSPGRRLPSSITEALRPTVLSPELRPPFLLVPVACLRTPALPLPPVTGWLFLTPSACPTRPWRLFLLCRPSPRRTAASWTAPSRSCSQEQGPPSLGLSAAALGELPRTPPDTRSQHAGLRLGCVGPLTCTHFTLMPGHTNFLQIRLALLSPQVMGYKISASKFSPSSVTFTSRQGQGQGQGQGETESQSQPLQSTSCQSTAQAAAQNPELGLQEGPGRLGRALIGHRQHAAQLAHHSNCRDAGAVPLNCRSPKEPPEDVKGNLTWNNPRAASAYCSEERCEGF